MKSATKNTYPRFPRSLRALTAVAAIGLLGSACTVVDSKPSVAPVEVSMPASPNVDPPTRETAVLNAEVKTTAMCLASKILDLSRERKAHPGMTVSEDAVGTEASIIIELPTSSAITGEQFRAVFYAQMGIDSTGLGDPANVKDASVGVFGINEAGALDRAQPQSLFSIVEVVDGSGYNTFIRGKNQTEGGVYVTNPTDGSNPNVQNLTTDVLLAGSGKANNIVDDVKRGVSPACI